MSVNRPGGGFGGATPMPQGIGGATPMPQGIAAMQQQIAALERELAAVQESLDAVANLSQALSRDLSSAGKRLPSLDRVPTGLGKFRLILRP